MSLQYSALNIDLARAAGINDFGGLGNILFSLASRVKKFEREENQDCAFSDIKDIRESIEGNDDAFRKLVERHQKKISSMMWRFSRDRLVHEELVQDVFVEAYMSLSSFKHKSPFSHWLSKIATRTGYRYWKLKSKKAENTVSLEAWNRELPLNSDEEKNSKSAEILDKLLEQLSPRDRLVITLRYLEQNSIEETAELTGWSESMVKVQTWRAKKKLQKLV